MQPTDVLAPATHRAAQTKSRQRRKTSQRATVCGKRETDS